MDQGTKYRVPIGDACVSMRVCFDSLCFSSPQQRPPDEEDVATPEAAGSSSPQLPTRGVAVSNTTATTTQVTQQVPPHIGGGTVNAMGTLREFQELLRVKEERITELETALCCRDAEIQELRSHLDKFLSVLPFSPAPPLTPTKPRTRDRAQGISAEPPLQELAPLKVVDKSDRLVRYNGISVFLGFFFHNFNLSLSSLRALRRHKRVEQTFFFLNTLRRTRCCVCNTTTFFRHLTHIKRS